jgi:hypothetical protein
MYLIHPGLSKPIVFILIGVQALLLGCKSVLPKDQDVVYKMATEKLGDAIDSFPSPSREYILFIQKVNSSNASNHLKLMVIHVTEHKVVHEQNFNPGYAKWITESSIEVLSVPGVMPENEDLSNYKKIINISPSNH